MEKINIREKFTLIQKYYDPHIVGELNGQCVKLVKFKGPFVWHHHKKEDELFLATKGKFKIEFKEKTVNIEEGEFIIVPHGVEHRPIAEEEVEVLLFEPSSTLNTGNFKDSEFTKEKLKRI